ncbi:hypothetical protein CMI48_00415 [Candidatus Pacearchaeota archaeon]|jgi:HAD superfamily hydrolase (TIGR01509 family)|nr:hypothetical protein [Candidatus Pacearchaeota archaeon]|tara:strand:+ start:104 stop:487 length:384 start_codon:yes stop_codon:yes gene_type:complete
MKTILVDAINTLIIKDSGINEELHQLLEQYPNKKIILTNANDEQMESFGLNNMPYPLFTLKHNPDKDDPEYFRKLLEDLKGGAEEMIYIEHNLGAVKSAQSVGITSHHYDPEKKDLQAVKQFLNENL